MKNRSTLTCLLTSVLCAGLIAAAFPAAAAEQQDTGLVLNIRNGNLERQSKDAWEVLAVGDPVGFKQRLKTDQRALAVLELPKVGRYILGPGSDVELGKDVPDATSSLKKGSLWVSANLSSGNSLTVQTALASSGVRGTMFTVIAGKNGMDLCTCHGDVEVTLKDGSKVNVGSGQSLNLGGKGQAKGPVGKGKLVLAKYDINHPQFGICFLCHAKGGGFKKGWNDNILFNTPTKAQ